ncbi:MAG: rRNA adenine N-6-methyltransferase family protein [Crocinitomicaceae bacterium]|nr:rRNA adenine N-6-methyltransferase family protein [Crocinitomicaceae bacterium]
MTTKRNFIKQFFKNKNMVGAITPSSKFLGKKMLSKIDFNSAKIIIELGPGTGVFTDLIIQRMAPDAKLFVFELNDNFYTSLAARITDPRVHVIHDSASNISKQLKTGEQADLIVSSLPLTVFSEKLRKSVITESHQILKETGTYVQFQYSLQAKRLLEATYKTVSVSFTLKNIPPAFIYKCIKT